MINIVHNADCLPAIREMKDNQFDLAIVDPPFGIGNWVQTGNKTKKWYRGESITWNENIPTKEYFIELQRISKEQIIWGANYYNCFSKKGGAIIWDKQNPNPSFSKAEIASYSRLKRVDVVVIPHYGFICSDEYRIHECQKPVSLYKWLLKNYAKEGDTILDTHVGSGSSRIACWEMGFDFTGFEIDKDYWEAQEKRFNVVRNQMRIF